jgi:hypothetical protein
VFTPTVYSLAGAGVGSLRGAAWGTVTVPEGYTVADAGSTVELA